MRISTFLAVVTIGLGLGGCQAGPAHTRAAGGIAGAATGAVLGGALSGRPEGALLGGIIGTAAGSAAGAQIARDQERCGPPPCEEDEGLEESPCDPEGRPVARHRRGRRVVVYEYGCCPPPLIQFGFGFGYGAGCWR